MRRLPLVALGAAAVLATVAVAAATLRADDDAGIEPSLEALVAAGMPGALVRVRNGRETIELARGEATPGIRFRVGSVTKTFVAVLALEAR